MVLIEAAIIDLKLPDTTRGVKRADRPFASVIQKCVRYVDTTLKLLMSIENSSEVGDETLYQICGRFMSLVETPKLYSNNKQSV